MERSNLSNKEYSLKDTVAVRDGKQQKLYIKHDAFPVDMYVTTDLVTGKEILVMLFNRYETKELYEKWKNFSLN